MKVKGKIFITLLAVLAVGIYYYVTIPAINIHSSDTWFVMIFLMIVFAAVYMVKKRIGKDEFRQNKIIKVFGVLILGLVIVYFVGAVLSSPIVNAKKYQQLMKVEEGKFASDVEELSFDKIPLLDRDTAQLLGDRKMGSMVDMVSQFEADDIYSQINYKDNPVRVSPLKYASLIKWIANRSEGIPAYIRINMATQNTELVKLEEGMKYMTCEHFNRKMVDYLKKALIYGHTSRISS